jgi:N-acetylglucosaminyldiphosphoundecaprenol N-acetyl-beta-D-mannosaminyltransferase
MAANEILGIRVDCVNQTQLLQRAVEGVQQPGQMRITYVNAHCLNLARDDNDYRRLLNQFDLVYSDGIGVVWAGRFLNQSHYYKVTGRAWIEQFCYQCSTENISLYLLGGKPGVAEMAKEHLVRRYPNLQVLGACDGYFHAKSEDKLIDELVINRPDVLLVGMGVPLQEKWIETHATMIPVKVCWAVGALLDYAAGIEPPVPMWMEKLALEWMWRMMVDPKHKWRRYLIGNPLFIIRVLKEKFRG